MARKFGIVVAPENKTVRRSDEMVLDTDVDQFKYYKTVPIKRVMPAAGTGTASIDVSFLHDLPYLPAFETYIKGYNGNWGKFSRGAQALGPSLNAAFPYEGVEYIDPLNYACTLFANGQNVPGGLPAHDIIIRLTLFYNEILT